jgi:hypothetical protein
MRQAAGLVFDEVVRDGWYVTSTELNGVLAVSDQIGIQAVVDNVTIGGPDPPTLSIQLETSGNGTHWATKNALPEIPPFTLVTSATTVSPYGGDSGALPTLRFARLRITLLAGGPGSVTAHVKVFVTLRDAGGEIIAPFVYVAVGPPLYPHHKDPQERENNHVVHTAGSASGSAD